MGFFSRFLIGLLGIALGVAMIYYREWFLSTFGRMATIEKYFGTFGGMRVFYPLFGALIAILSVLYIFGVFPQIFVNWFIGVFGISG